MPFLPPPRFTRTLNKPSRLSRSKHRKGGHCNGTDTVTLYRPGVSTMFKEELVLRGVIVGASIAVGSWKSYLIFRNTKMLRGMPEPPNELDLNYAVYEQLQKRTELETERLLLITVIEVNVRLAKLVFNYFPYIWKLSGDYGTTLVSQAMWFAAIDKCLEASVGIPIAFHHALLTGDNPLFRVLEQIFDAAFRGLLAALATYVIIYLTDNFGASSIMKGLLALNALGLLSMAFYIRFMISLDHERLPDNDLGKTVTTLAKKVGYPSNTIYVDKRSPEPNAYYSTAIFSKVILIADSLITSLDATQVTSVVAHELGHWKYNHPLYNYLGQLIQKVAMGYVWILAYGSTKLISVFQLDPEVHPIIPVYLSFYFIWPLFTDLNQGIFNLFKTRFEFVADDYACNLWGGKHLRAALVKVSTKMKSFPLLDNWFAAWFIGHPSILQRIRRIDALMQYE